MCSVPHGSSKRHREFQCDREKKKKMKKKTQTHTKKIYFDSDLEPFILELRKYTRKKQQQQKTIIMNTIHTHITRARENEMLLFGM